MSNVLQFPYWRISRRKGWLEDGLIDLTIDPYQIDFWEFGFKVHDEYANYYEEEYGEEYKGIPECILEPSEEELAALANDQGGA